MPHNPTPQEREACEKRIRAVQARHMPHTPSDSPSRLANRDAPLGEIKRGGTTGGGSNGERLRPVLEVSPPPLFIPSFSNGEDHEEEDSAGPETPYSAHMHWWQDSLPGAPCLKGQQPRPNRRVSFGTHHCEPTADCARSTPQTTPTANTRLGESVPLAEADDLSSSETNGASTAAHSEIDQVIHEYNTLVLHFKFPQNLDFATSAEGKYLPQLTHTPANKGLLEHTHKLEKLLERLDDVQSNGNRGVQRKRKQAVDRLIQELEELKRMQAEACLNVSPMTCRHCSPY